MSAFQIQFASTDVTTPGDHADVLVAMNPAALKADLGTVVRGGTLILNEDAFQQRNLDKAGYAADPRTDGTLDGYQVYSVPMTSITVRAVEPVGVGKKEAERAKNMFALGLVSWMYDRPTAPTLEWLERKFGSKPEILDANVAAFNAGYNFGETTELFAHRVEVKAAPAEPGTYRNVAGAQALAWGLIAASRASGLPLFYASYPITPASDLLHELSRHKHFGVITVQAEDEIAAANMALGAAFTGQLAVTGTSGPGPGPEGRDDRPRGDHRAPDDRRGRPASRPVHRDADQDRAGRPAGRDVRTARGVADPDRVGVLALGVLRGGARRGARRDPVPHPGDLALGLVPAELLRAVAAARRVGDRDDRPALRTSPTARRSIRMRATRTVARPWAIPGTPGLQHRIGGLEREDVTGIDQLRRREPRADDRPPPREGGGDRRRRCRRSRWTIRPATPTCWCSAGDRRPARSAPRSDAPATAASASRTPTCGG